ncbi:MAG: hypothetical protein EPN93_13670 [Spirochaetes bacterium]|nr:MAG: hypothetical protein EPN93_13670 [Spirochaetota bacterium]
MSLKREHGAVQPGIPLGPLTLRLPFIHYKFEWADYVQGLIMCTVCLSIITILTEKLGMSFEVALAIVVLNGALYLAHVTFGDMVVPGWITPAIPLLIAYCETFPMGSERIQALIAFELTFGLFCILLGLTGLAKKFIALVPNAIQSAVLLGAGFAAVMLVFDPKSKGLRSFDSNPWTITICIGLVFYLLFSESFKRFRRQYKWAGLISNLGIMPALALAIIVGPLAGELQWPQYDGSIFTTPDFITLWKDFTIFGAIPFPPLSMFISGLPMVFSAYVVAFGEIIQSQALLDDAQKYRPDEKIDYDANRSHIIFGGRNALMSIFGPDISMCGPMWAAMTVVVCDRFKHGPKAMDSIHSGAGSFRWGTFTGYFVAPIVSSVKPILGVGLALTMLVQGFVAVRVGVLKSRAFNDLGIAGVAGAVLAVRGAAWGLAVATILTALVYISKNWRKAYEQEEPVFPCDSPACIQKEVEEAMAESQ